MDGCKSIFLWELELPTGHQGAASVSEGPSQRDTLPADRAALERRSLEVQPPCLFLSS